MVVNMICSAMIFNTAAFDLFIQFGWNKMIVASCCCNIRVSFFDMVLPFLTASFFVVMAFTNWFWLDHIIWVYSSMVLPFQQGFFQLLGIVSVIRLKNKDT